MCQYALARAAPHTRSPRLAVSESSRCGMCLAGSAAPPRGLGRSSRLPSSRAFVPRWPGWDGQGSHVRSQAAKSCGVWRWGKRIGYALFVFALTGTCWRQRGTHAGSKTWRPRCYVLRKAMHRCEFSISRALASPHSRMLLQRKRI